MNDINLYEGIDSFKLLVEGIEYVVREPIGWDEFSYKFRRHDDYNGFINEFTDEDLMLKFDDYTGLEYVKAAYLSKGIDAEIYLLFGTGTGVLFQELFRARVDLAEYSLQSEYIEVTLSSNSKREKLINRKLIKVDVNGNKTLDNQDMIPLSEGLYRFHSKVLQKKSVLIKSLDSAAAFRSSNLTYYVFTSTTSVLMQTPPQFGTFGLDYLDINELHYTYYYPEPTIRYGAFASELFIYKAKERGEHTINIDLFYELRLEQIFYFKSINGNTAESTYDCISNLLQIDIILEIGDEVYTLATYTATDCEEYILETGLINLTDTKTVYLDQNTTVKLYAVYSTEREVENFSNISELTFSQAARIDVKQNSSIIITADTESRYSDVGAMLIYDCMDKAIEAVMNEKSIFKSTFMGRPDLGYLNYGCGSKYALTNGKKIRAISEVESHLKFTTDDAFKSLDSIFCLGMGIELSNGEFYLIGEILEGQNLQTTFLIPYFQESSIDIYILVSDPGDPILAFEFLGNLADLNISGSGTFADPYIYTGTPGFPLSDYTGLIKIVVSYLVNREIVRLEQRDYFYRDALLFEIPAANIIRDSYEETPDLDLIYNQVEIGYEKFPENDLNTLDEFNTRQEYATPIKNNRNKLEKLSKFIASGYAIEFQRRKTFENEQENKGSSPYDDDVFIVAMTTEKYEVGIKRFTNSNAIFLTQLLSNPPEIGSTITVAGTSFNNGNYTVSSVSEYGIIPKRTVINVIQATSDELFLPNAVVKYEGGEFSPERSQPFLSVSGVIGPNSSYNLRISPKRMLYNWAKWINSGLFHKVSADILKSTFTKGNLLVGGLVSQFKDTETCLLGDQDRELITEGSDVTLSDFNGFRKMFKPYRIRFKARINYVDLKYIIDKHQTESENSYGYIRFTDLDGNIRNAWLRELNYNPSLEIVEFILREKA